MTKITNLSHGEIAAINGGSITASSRSLGSMLGALHGFKRATRAVDADAADPDKSVSSVGKIFMTCLGVIIGAKIGATAGLLVGEVAERLLAGLCDQSVKS